MTLSLATQLVRETKSRIFAAGLAIAEAIGLPVSTWRSGDPTRALFRLESEHLESLDVVAAGYVASGFLDHATGMWLKILAEQVFGVVVPEATYATTDVVLTNSGGLVLEDLGPGDVIVKNSTTGKTYTSTTGGDLLAGGTLTITVVADEPGSDSSAAAGEIDEIVTTMLGVTVANAAAAVGTDEQSEETTRQQCRDKLGSLSPNGPAEAYTYVARTPSLTGTTAVTRARVYDDSETGEVQLYLAGPSGAVSGPDRTLVEAAIARLATPLCITPIVASATGVPVVVTYTLWVYDTSNHTAGEVEELVEDALEQLFASREIGGDIIPPATTGKLYKSLIESTIRGVLPEAFRVSLSAPAADIDLENDEVATLSTITATVNLVEGP